LDATHLDPATDPARAEIQRTLREGARTALHEIDSALSRIQQGTYSRCPRCGGTISEHRLRALPMTLLCGRCQRTTAARTDAEPVHVSSGCAPAKP
jgi:RNA polymerase-binding transcription factor DksA